jgi:hypothetical protein
MDLPNWPDYVPTYKHYSLTSVRAAKTEPTNFPFAKMELALLPDEKLENVLDMIMIYPFSFENKRLQNSGRPLRNNQRSFCFTSDDVIDRSTYFVLVLL